MSNEIPGLQLHPGRGDKHRQQKAQEDREYEDLLRDLDIEPGEDVDLVDEDLNLGNIAYDATAVLGEYADAFDDQVFQDLRNQLKTELDTAKQEMKEKQDLESVYQRKIKEIQISQQDLNKIKSIVESKELSNRISALTKHSGELHTVLEKEQMTLTQVETQLEDLVKHTTSLDRLIFKWDEFLSIAENEADIAKRIAERTSEFLLSQNEKSQLRQRIIQRMERERVQRVQELKELTQRNIQLISQIDGLKRSLHVVKDERESRLMRIKQTESLFDQSLHIFENIDLKIQEQVEKGNLNIADIRDKVTQGRSISDEIVDTRRAIEELHSVTDKIAVQLSFEKTALVERQETLVEEKQKIHPLTTNITILADDIRKINKTLRGLDQTFTQTQQKTNDIILAHQQMYTEKLIPLQSQVEMNSTVINSLGVVESTQSDGSSISHHPMNISSELSKVQDEIDAKLRQIADLKEKVALVSLKISKHQSEINSLNFEKDSIRSLQLSELGKTQKEKASIINKAILDVEHNRMVIQKLLSKWDRLEVELRSRASTDSTQAQLFISQQEIKDLEAERSKIQEKWFNLESSYLSLEKEKARISSQVDSNIQMCNVLTNRQNRFETVCETQNREIFALNKKCDGLSIQLDAIKYQTSLAEDELSQFVDSGTQKAIHKLEDEISTKRQTLIQLEDTLSHKKLSILEAGQQQISLSQEYIRIESEIRHHLSLNVAAKDRERVKALELKKMKLDSAEKLIDSTMSRISEISDAIKIFVAQKQDLSSKARILSQMIANPSSQQNPSAGPRYGQSSLSSIVRGLTKDLKHYHAKISKVDGRIQSLHDQYDENQEEISQLISSISSGAGFTNFLRISQHFVKFCNCWAFDSILFPLQQLSSLLSSIHDVVDSNSSSKQSKKQIQKMLVRFSPTPSSVSLGKSGHRSGNSSHQVSLNSKTSLEDKIHFELLPQNCTSEYASLSIQSIVSIFLNFVAGMVIEYTQSHTQQLCQFRFLSDQSPFNSLYFLINSPQILSKKSRQLVSTLSIPPNPFKIVPDDHILSCWKLVMADLKKSVKIIDENAASLYPQSLPSIFCFAQMISKTFSKIYESIGAVSG